jgi:hypothetical protein
MRLREMPLKQGCGTMLKNIMSKETVNVVMDDGWVQGRNRFMKIIFSRR